MSSSESLRGLLLAASLLGGSGAAQPPIRGVAPEDLSRYQAAEFQCPGGGPVVSRTVINDDFCDCPGGGDEPGTGACAGAEQFSSKGFYCSNHGLTPRYIYQSRVGDGVCDCCDGSDEWQTGVCSDKCEEIHKAQREHDEERRRVNEKGIAMKRKALEAAGTPEIWTARVSELKGTLPKLEAEVAISKTKLSIAEAAFQNVEKSKATQQQASQTGAEGSGEKKVSEYAKWMESENVNSPSKRVAVDYRRLREVKVKSGDLVDFVEFHYTKGDPLITGGGKGNEQEPFLLQPGEAIVEVRGGQGGLLDGIEFVTNKGRSSNKYGGKGGDPYSFKSGPGMMIVGLERSDGVAGKIAGIQECTLEDPRSAEERARDDAKTAFDVRDRRMAGVLAEVRDLEARLAGDFKQDTRDAYSLFEEKCASGHLDKYNYKICIFGSAKQDHTTLGNWAGWDQKEKNVARFDGGQRCFSGITRTIRVIVECGDSMRVLRAWEPSQCTYEATITHPAACEVDTPGREGQSAVRVLQAHEGHDEL